MIYEIEKNSFDSLIYMQKRKKIIKLKNKSINIFQNEAQRKKMIKNQEDPKAVGQY